MAQFRWEKQQPLCVSTRVFPAGGQLILKPKYRVEPYRAYRRFFLGPLLSCSGQITTIQMWMEGQRGEPDMTEQSSCGAKNILWCVNPFWNRCPDAAHKSRCSHLSGREPHHHPKTTGISVQATPHPHPPFRLTVRDRSCVQTAEPHLAQWNICVGFSLFPCAILLEPFICTLTARPVPRFPWFPWKRPRHTFGLLIYHYYYCYIHYY